jgi:hypothetical protein
MPESGRPSYGAQGGRVGSGSSLADLLTAGTGITITSGGADPQTVSANLSVGVAGGQSVIGGSAASESLTLSSTSNATKGKIIFGTSTGGQFDESTGFLSLGIATATTNLHVANTSSNNPRGIMSAQYTSTAGAAQFVGRKARGTPTAPTVIVNGDSLANFIPEAYDGASFVQGGAFLFVSNGVVGAGSVPTDALFFTGSSAQGTERWRITSLGHQRNINMPYVSWTSAGAALTQANGTVFEYGITPPVVASAAGAVLDAHKWDAVTCTISGATNITTATGFNFKDIEQPTYSAASALSIAHAATLAIKGGPIGGGAGPVTLTRSYAIWSQAGENRFDGNITANGATNFFSGVSIAAGGQVDNNNSNSALILKGYGGAAALINCVVNATSYLQIWDAAANGPGVTLPQATENLILFATSTTNMQTGQGVVYVANATTVPTGNPAGGGYLYASAGALKWRGSAGTVTNIANA